MGVFLGILAFIFLGIPLLMMIVMFVGMSPFLFISDIIDKKKSEKEYEEKARQMGETRSNELYKSVLSYLNDITSKQLKEVPSNAKTKTPSEWVNNIYIAFGRFDITVLYQKKDGTEHATVKKNYCDFGYEEYKHIPYFEETLISDLKKHFPQIDYSHESVNIDNKYYHITISFNKEYDKYSPYKK